MVAVGDLATADWANSLGQRHARQVARDAVATVFSGEPTPLSIWDHGDLYNVGSIAYGGGLFVPSVSGLYLWALTVDWPDTTMNHYRSHSVWVNGAPAGYDQGQSDWSYFDSVSDHVLSASGPIPLAAGDSIQAVVYHTGGDTFEIYPKTFTLALVG